MKTLDGSVACVQVVRSVLLPIMKVKSAALKVSFRGKEDPIGHPLDI